MLLPRYCSACRGAALVGSQWQSRMVSGGLGAAPSLLGWCGGSGTGLSVVFGVVLTVLWCHCVVNSLSWAVRAHAVSW